ncbi:phospholipid-translocating P-type ATPase [Punctularia strigosozonata HHB-11173 SS5]|uniref:phospholipid-translocating P-type ATPase n=1 Tax=Punctularia strigosozonata (strain HHB-11173) TaxID=741275 RepID=UPI0004417544|nr:phospholipid-translocating P-type ATPase [Punctularia strigosozonata HHB-11173 SS5]EIN05442.1 phospholipid-translocating P-type ATPase [Punctularia strigosozonata HHB-11173 SS5]
MKRQPSAVDEPDTDEEQDVMQNIDPELRLRTVRTAASTIAESNRNEEQRAARRKNVKRKRSRFFRRDRKQASEAESAASALKPGVIPGKRRNVYVNMPLTAMEVDAHGEPVERYVRNKVRTSKYTIVTFVPKNLFEQFYRAANIFFLVMAVAQAFPIFGAASPQISMLPLVFILTVTAIKDGIEDYRRASLDEEVNTSAATKLGGSFRNVNQPTDPREWWEKLLGLNKPGRVTKGVRRLREKDAEAGRERIVLERAGGEDDGRSTMDTVRGNDSRVTLGGKLEDIQSIDEHSYPPGLAMTADASMSMSSTALVSMGIADDGSSTQLAGNTLRGTGADSVRSRPSNQWGVLDLNKRSSGTAIWERTLWKKLEVGDIVLLRDDEQVPADIIVLATSDADGMCYLETKNLDGETNLKPRRALKATAAIRSEEDIERASFVLDSEPPHANLYLYNGQLRYRDPASPSGEEKREAVTINELLLRGCTVRNTAWIIGLVAFTGADTKIMLNGGETPSKRSKIEKETNFNVVMNFIVLIGMCAFAAVGSGIMDGKGNTSAHFFEQHADATDSHVVNALVTFVASLIAFQNIVPISLYISIEIVKTIQAYLISQDVDMYYEPFDTACVPKTWNICDDLGQIEYVFSDKTGTLTQNVMEFQKCSIRGIVYGENITEAQRGAEKRKGEASGDPEEHKEKMVRMKKGMVDKMNRAFKNRYMQLDKLTLVAPNLAEDLTDRTREQRSHCIAFFRALAVCHSVLANKPEPQTKPFLVNYKAESPDEAALVAAARDVGFPFLQRTKDAIDIEVMGQHERYVPLKVLEFNSTRKRMSVVVRNPEGKIVLYCKGADSVIYERLAADHDPELKERTSKDMEAFANGGLRTLCIAYRYMSEAEYFDWSRKYDEASAAIKDRDEEIDKANDLVEKDLLILGATALEDKLQEGVPEAIETLHSAGIKLWILTGDKVQTAIEIGFSCNLLKSTMDIMILSAESLHGARTQIEAGLNKIASVLGPPSLDPRHRGFMPNAKASFAVVIDGDTLRHAFDTSVKPLFLNLATQCETVVCCRVSPAQKALTVKMVKEGREAMTLSIGDGANDVAMIQEANIGCGLFGLEGSQAAMSADYAFGQFRFLTKLLIVHGRWSYQRIADMHSNFFYKNVIWTFAMFWYLPWNSFDSTYLYQYTFILLCNLVFTSLPVIAMGAFDQDINAKAALAFPQLYVRGIRGLEYTRTKFWLYMLDGLYQSAVVYFIGYFTWVLGPAVSWNGKAMDSLSDFGTTVSVAAIFAANFYVGLNTHYWTIITWVVVFGSSLIMVAWIAIYSFFDTPDFNDEVAILYGGITFWATIVISVVLALTPRYLVKFVSSAYMPLDRDIVREMWVKGDLKDRLGIKHHRDRTRADPEAVPMYKNVHFRAESEMGGDDGYEPVEMRSPPTMSPSPSSTPMASTPYFDSPHAPEQAHTHDGEAEAQYVTAPARPDGGLSPYPPTRSPLPTSVSPAPSYYSSSQIPPPSPMPPTVFSPAVQSPRTPSSGVSLHPIRTSVPTRPAAFDEEPLTPTPTTPHPMSPTLLQVPGSPASGAAPHAVHFQHASGLPSHDHDPLRSPPPDRTDLSRASEWTQGTYATAQEGYTSQGEDWSDDYDREEDRSPAPHGHVRPASYQSWTPRAI